MKIRMRALSAALLAALGLGAVAETQNPQAVRDMLNRIGGAGTADRFVTVLDETLDTTDGSETFVLTSSDGKPCIKGSTLSALTTGIGWYLNHTANVNLSWNNLTTDLSSVALPLPAEETHSTTQKYRYYMNFCTFSYSASTWTWERWQKEIDWMALHGINMPLQIVGLEEVWRQFLMEDYGYSKTEANNFIAGPCFMAWFGMNNLMGHGGSNPDWWYERQAQMGKKMNARMKELGMEPVLPGYAGSAPTDFQSKAGVPTLAQGGWCGFTRPHLIDPNNEKFAEVAAKFYARVDAVMGKSKYYAIDPFHEGANTSAINVPTAYTSLYNAFNSAAPDAQWVIQSWQWSGAQRNVLNKVPVGKLVVLDLYSDGRPGWGNYGNHDVVYSTIFNFGARTGFFGRLNGVIDGFFNARNKSTVRGIGAAPEGIEQVPVLYDLLFELPWHATKPDAAKWIADYAKYRYNGAESAEAAEAWELLRNSAIDCNTDLQGPNEGVVCARPALEIRKVSSWGGTQIFYDENDVAKAAYKLLAANLSGENYNYDLADVTRQALMNYAKSLLAGIKEANDKGDTELFNKRRDAFLQLILDLDELLATNALFTLGNWTETARAIADEMTGTTDADRNWLEFENAREIITTWGEQGTSEGGGLHDYSYRAWSGMLKDFYYERWKLWFDNGMKAPNGGWYQWEWKWAHDTSTAGKYKATATGDTREVAGRMLPKYIYVLRSANGEETYAGAMLGSEYKAKFLDRTGRGTAYTPNITTGEAKVAEIAIDFNRNTTFADDEISVGETFAIPADAPVGERTVRVALTDGTMITYTLAIVEEITADRTVSVRSADSAKGSASIEGAEGTSVTNKEIVTVKATPALGYDFDHWTDAAGNDLGTDNPYKYYGKESTELVANFIVNKWGVPDCSGYELDPVKTNNQWFQSISVTQGGETSDIYTATAAPDQGFVNVPTRVRVAPGGEFKIAYNAPNTHPAMFVTAYVDLNCDGTFDMDDKELLVKRGNYGGNLGGVGTGEFTVLLPYDVPKGVTHLRLRFDSSWNAGAYDSTVGAMKPTASTNRLIYEIILEVNDSPDYPCTISYKPNNDKFGTMRSENESGVYAPGETAIITAFPNPGYSVVSWVDNHGRELPKEWISGNAISFPVFDNAQITAVLEPAATIDANGWSFAFETGVDGTHRLMSVVTEGDPELDLSAYNPLGIEPGIFDGTKLEALTLPNGGLSEVGDVFVNTSVTGSCTGTDQKLVTTPDMTIPSDRPWTLVLEGNTDGSAMNEWGSCLLAAGDNAFKDWQDFQIYLQSQTNGKSIVVKWKNNTDKYKFTLPLMGNFRLELNYTGTANGNTITLTDAEGKTQTLTLEDTSAEISQFVSCIPAGVNISALKIYSTVEQQPADIIGKNLHFNEYRTQSSATAYHAEDGILYAAGSESDVIAYPYGMLFTRAFRLHNGQGAYIHTRANTTNGTGASSNHDGLGDSNPDSDAATLLALNLESWGPGSHKVNHLNSRSNIQAQCTYFINDFSKGVGVDPTISYEGGDPVIRLQSQSGTKPYLTITAQGRMGTAADGSLRLEYARDIEVKANGKGFATAMFPLDVTVPADAQVFIATGINVADKCLELSPLSAGEVISKGTAVLVKSENNVRFPIHYASLNGGVIVKAPALRAAAATNILHGTTMNHTAVPAHYQLDGDKLVKRDANTTVPANSAYILATDVDAALGTEFYVEKQDTGTGIEEIEAGSAAGLKLYDLQGRRVTNPRRGIYIGSDGRKIMVR